MAHSDIDKAPAPDVLRNKIGGETHKFLEEWGKISASCNDGSCTVPENSPADVSAHKLASDVATAQSLVVKGIDGIHYESPFTDLDSSTSAYGKMWEKTVNSPNWRAATKELTLALNDEFKKAGLKDRFGYMLAKDGSVSIFRYQYDGEFDPRPELTKEPEGPVSQLQLHTIHDGKRAAVVSSECIVKDNPYTPRGEVIASIGAPPANKQQGDVTTLASNKTPAPEQKQGTKIVDTNPSEQTSEARMQPPLESGGK
jgi:hypothetical protein